MPSLSTQEKFDEDQMKLNEQRLTKRELSAALTRYRRENNLDVETDAVLMQQQGNNIRLEPLSKDSLGKKGIHQIKQPVEGKTKVLNYLLHSFTS